MVVIIPLWWSASAWPHLYHLFPQLCLSLWLMLGSRLLYLFQFLVIPPLLFHCLECSYLPSLLLHFIYSIISSRKLHYKYTQLPWDLSLKEVSLSGSHASLSSHSILYFSFVSLFSEMFLFPPMSINSVRRDPVPRFATDYIYMIPRFVTGYIGWILKKVTTWKLKFINR